MNDKMPIWDVAQYFGVPIETTLTLTASPQQIVAGDPMRRFLMFNVNPGVGAVTHQLIAALSIRPSFAATEGLIGLTIQDEWIMLSWDNIGPFVQQAWFAQLGAGVAAGPVLSAGTVAYNRWPGDERSLNLLERIDQNAARSIGRQANGNGALRQRRRDSRPKPATSADSDIAALILSCQRGIERDCHRNVWLAPNGWRVPSGTG